MGEIFINKQIPFDGNFVVMVSASAFMFMFLVGSVGQKSGVILSESGCAFGIYGHWFNSGRMVRLLAK